MVNYKLKYLQELSSPLEAKHLSAAWQKNFRAADICWEEKKALCLSADICREKKKHFDGLPTFAERKKSTLTVCRHLQREKKALCYLADICRASSKVFAGICLCGKRPLQSSINH